jgi:hypothetical protein
MRSMSIAFRALATTRALFLASVVSLLVATLSPATTYDRRPRQTAILPISGQFIAQDSWDGLGLYQLSDLTLVRTFRARASVNTFDVTKDEQTLLIGSDDGSLRTFDVATGEKLWERFPWQIGQHYSQDVCFSHDGKSVVVCGQDDKAVVFEARTSRWICTVRFPPHQTNTMSAALSPDGRKGVVLELGGRLYAFDVATGQLQPTGVTGAWPVRYSTDGKYVALRSDNSGLREHLRVVKTDGTWSFRDLGEFSYIGHIRPIPDGGFLAAAEVRNDECCLGVRCRPDPGRLEQVWRLVTDGREKTDFEINSAIGVATDYRLVTTVLDLRTGSELGSLDNSANYRPIVMTYTSADVYEATVKRFRQAGGLAVVGFLALCCIAGVAVWRRQTRRRAAR